MAELRDAVTADAVDDRFLWLEDSDAEPVIEWARQRSAVTTAELGGERFEQLRAEALQSADSSDRIPAVQRHGDHLYNFWRDSEHPRGLWRRTTLDEYRKDAPQWEVVLDVDALAAADDENWVWGGADLIEPEHTRALLNLSRGGSDTSSVREFDMTRFQFVPDGFNLPEARSDVSWEDENTVLVGTDFGEGSMSAAGLPLLLKRWRRGTPLEEAETVFTGAETDLAVFSIVDRTPGYERTIFIRKTDNISQETLVLQKGRPVRLDVPPNASVGVHRQWLVIPVPTDWVRGDITYKTGTVLLADLDEFIAGTAELRIVFEPDSRNFFQTARWTKDHLVVVSLRDVTSCVEVVTPGSWKVNPIPGVPANTNTGVHSVDSLSDEIFLVASGFDKPPTLLHGYAGESVREVKSGVPRFDASDLIVSQHFASSLDGTSIPYFLVAHRDAAGPGPTLLAGYGGFAQSQRPTYLGVTGRLWLERGGFYALANIRGGAEYGADWYFQSVGAGRHRVHEDFAAVATDLTDRGVTTAGQLGAAGVSAGGLLMGVMLTQYPELFGALVCRQPLLDMRRFPLLGAGAAVTSEYGNPDDPADWEFLRQYSPYHNIDAGRSYPPILIMTSSNDDRVHPAHARKMAAALADTGHRVLFYENTEGGHAGASNNAQAAFESALMCEFLHRTLNP